MKRLITTLIITICVVSASLAQNHLKFYGIEMGQDLTGFCKELFNKGFKPSENCRRGTEDILFLIGNYMGDDVDLNVRYNKYTFAVCQVLVTFPMEDTQKAIDRIKTLDKALQLKYPNARRETDDDDEDGYSIAFILDEGSCSIHYEVLDVGVEVKLFYLDKLSNDAYNAKKIRDKSDCL